MYCNHQHMERGSGDSGHYSVALWNAMIDYITRVKYAIADHKRIYFKSSLIVGAFQTPVLAGRSRDDQSVAWTMKQCFFVKGFY